MDFSILQPLMEGIQALLAQYPMAGAWYTAIVRFVFPILAVGILAGAIRSMLKVKHLPEVWAYLTLPNGGEEPLTHWENIIGRSGASDVVLNYPVVSRQHAALIRGEDENWTVHDLDSKGGVTVNGKEIDRQAPVSYGDVIGLGGVETVLLSVSPEEEARHGLAPGPALLGRGGGAAETAGDRRTAGLSLGTAGAAHRLSGAHRLTAHHQRGRRGHGHHSHHFFVFYGADVGVFSGAAGGPPGGI